MMESKKMYQTAVSTERYYGCVELMTSFDSRGKIRNQGRFRIEPGEVVSTMILDESNIEIPSNDSIFLENPESEIRWYFRYFLGKAHDNYTGLDQNKEPFFFSVIGVENQEGPSHLQHQRAILWTNKGSKKLCLSYSSSRLNPTKMIIKKFAEFEEFTPILKHIVNPKLQKELTMLEDQEGSTNFKFGIIFAKQGQTSDSEMMSNEFGDSSFEAFIHTLGAEISLLDWKGYRGGLDIKSNSTGQTSIYTIFEGHEIMFHVSTKLPYSHENKQQVERKRHIGNDIVNIVFEVGGDPDSPRFNPSMMKSHFTHIFALVTYGHDRYYRLWIFSEESVPPFGPILPGPCRFNSPENLKAFLLTKLINGEKAAFNSHVFASKRERTLDFLIKDMYMEYQRDDRRRLNRLDSAMRTLKLKHNDHGTAEFVRIGQSLKCENTWNGDAPVDATATALYRKQPWDPHLLNASLDENVVAADLLKKNVLLYSPRSGGLHLIDVAESPPKKQELLNSITVLKIDVLVNYGIFLMRGIEKGCSSYSVNSGARLQLVIAVSIGHKIKLFQWQHSTTWALRQVSDDELGSNFQFIREIVLSEEPIATGVFDSYGLQLCIAFKHHFDLIQLRQAESSHCIRKSEIKIVNAIIGGSLHASNEVLITYSNLTFVYDFTNCRRNIGGTLQEMMLISWTSTPAQLVYVFPIMIAFCVDNIEIRLAINGNLLATIMMPNLRLLGVKDCIMFTSEPSPTKKSPWSPKSRQNHIGLLSRASSGSGSASIVRRPRKLYSISLARLQEIAPQSGQVSNNMHVPLNRQRSNPTRSSSDVQHCIDNSEPSSLLVPMSRPGHRSFKKPNAATLVGSNGTFVSPIGDTKRVMK